MRLVYVSDRETGYLRELRRGRFVYLSASNAPIRDDRVLRRIRSLAIPPAYTDVWICRIANGHLQSTGRDARGRKQYRYHPRWREQRDAAKYDRMLDFSRRLARLRRRVAIDLRQSGMPRTRVLATIVRLLEASLIRVGNEEYARTNRSFGLTTLHNGHVRIRGERLEFQFRGKSGQFHNFRLEDARLARIVRRCQDLPGQMLFQYRDETGAAQNIRSDDVNDYIRLIAGAEFSAKDFRTWAGTVMTASLLAARSPPHNESAVQTQIAQVIKRVAERLGNTPRICRSCYVHPEVLKAYAQGRLSVPANSPTMATSRLSGAERAVQSLLRRYRTRKG